MPAFDGREEEEEEEEYEEQSHTNEKSNEPEEAPPALSVLGSIVERKVSRNSSGKQAYSKEGKQSRFVRQRQLQAPPAGGFPSVNAPLGTFARVQPKKKENERAVIPPVNDFDFSTSKSGNKTTSLSSVDSLMQDSSRDAEGMMSQMSNMDIQESLQELSSSMSPDTLAFLKKRAAQKKSAQSASPATATTNANIPLPTPTTTPRTTIGVSFAVKPKRVAVASDRSLEKDRMAQVLSSIKTYDDLDAAYSAEMGALESTVEDSATAATTTAYAAPATTATDDFDLATSLLRSTVPRQNLWAARVVYHRLQDDWEQGRLCSVQGGSATTPWPYPAFLPISLRCLLDASFVHVNGYVLHTYVLQSLYTLLKLRACVDHVVDASGASKTAAPIYQEHFLDDAVPAPPLDTCYASIAVQPLAVGGTENVAYTTSSTTASAQSDGEAFCKDPMWTLLSRMRLIPRLSELLQSKEVPSSLLPDEALVAICGILAMLGQRSPGAASAIVQHPTLLGDLLELTLMPRDNSPHGGTTIALAAVILLSTLARQSRVTAAGLNVDTILPGLLATKPANVTEFKLQQWTLVLWRTLLRYGICLGPLSTMLTLAAPHLTLGSAQSFSLSAEYFSVFANVLSCIRVARIAAKEEEKITEDQREILSNASIWLSSTARLAIGHLESQAAIRSGGEEGRLARLRSNTGCLRFLTSFFAMTEDPESATSGEYKSEDVTVAEEAACALALLNLSQNEDATHAYGAVLPCATQVHVPATIEKNDTSLAFEAASCAFVESMLTFVMALRSRIDHSTTKGTGGEMIDRVESHLDDLSVQLITSFTGLLQSGSPKPVVVPVVKVDPQRARSDWLNRSHAAVFKFLASSSVPIDSSGCQALGFAVLGRLATGDEELAAILLSYDSMFSPHSVPSSSGEPSPLSTMLVREMCRSPQARNQLDHSFKLHNGLGITSDGLGPFDLHSLNSEAEAMGPKSSDSDLLLPMGNHWLWQILSSSAVRPQTTETDDFPENEAKQVLTSCLQIIRDVEEWDKQGTASDVSLLESGAKPEHLMDTEEWDMDEPDEQGTVFYASQFKSGAKLYHLMNVCFHSEELLGNASITFPSMQLFDIYIRAVDAKFVQDFAETCLLHSTPPATNQADAKLTENEERLKSHLYGDALTDTTLSNQAFRALEAFVNDLRAGYTTHGAQYPFYTRCLRAFLLPAFPSKIRCEVLRSLRGMLHLLTLPDDTKTTLGPLLKMSLLGGLPTVDGSTRDAPVILDTFAETLAFDKNKAELDHGYVSLLAVALLARSLAISLRTDSSGVIVAKRRIQSLPTAWGIRVLETVFSFLSSEGTAKDLVNATLACFDPQDGEASGKLQSRFTHTGLDNDAAWDLAMSTLKEAS